MNYFEKFNTLINWVFLKNISGSFIGRVLLIVALSPLLAKLVGLLNYFNIDEVWKIQLIILGSLLFLFGNLLIIVLIPDIINKYPNIDLYINKCISELDYIHFDLEFSKLENINLDDDLLSKYNPVFNKIKDFLPISSGKNLIGKKKSIKLYATALYHYENLSRSALRLISFILLLFGIFFISTPTILGVINIFIGKIL